MSKIDFENASDNVAKSFLTVVIKSAQVPTGSVFYWLFEKRFLARNEKKNGKGQKKNIKIQDVR